MKTNSAFRVVPLSYSVVEAARRTLPGNSGYADPGRWPPQIDPCNRAFRAYNAAEEIVDACVGNDEPESAIATLFADPAVEVIHARSLTYGCFTFKIERA